jgi:hypothetical protein
MADPTTKESSLATTYRKMATAEIERRLAAGDLTPMAANVAGEELRRREDEGDEMKPVDAGSPWPLLALLVIQAVVVIGFAMIARSDMVGIALAVELPILAAMIGKAFPRLGLVVGYLLAPFPIYAVVYIIWMVGWSHEPSLLVALLALIYIVLSFILSAVGVMMLLGSQHSGSWSDFLGWLQDRQTAAAAKAREYKG